MTIVMNEPCPSCQEMGHDESGNHLMVFEDGARYCKRSHWHKNGLPLFMPAGSNSPILDMEVNGTIKYTQDQFKQLVEEGKIKGPVMRTIALSGMRGNDRWSVSSDAERKEMLDERSADENYFNRLKVRNLTSRNIRGEIAKLYNVRVGAAPNGEVARHYYPVHSRVDGKWQGAKCRTLPKDFKTGHLGWLWGDTQLFGQQTQEAVLKSGGRRDTLLLTGGECDAMAACDMLLSSKVGTKWEGQLSHVWSPSNGEMALEQIIANKDSINQFSKIIVCFDNDAVGNKMNQEVAKLFRGKTTKLLLPSGCKDPNECLERGYEKEFVDAWWKPVDPFDGGSLSSASKYRDKAKITPVMGYSWPWPSMDSVTYGIRPNYLSVWGAGTGVGKTKSTKEVAFHLINKHKQPVVVMYLEEPADKTVRSFAGQLINKELTSPPTHDKSDPDYTEMRDYTKEEADRAIDELCDSGMLIVADLEGNKDVGFIMEKLEEALALGYTHYIIDNLTAFQHTGKDGKQASKTEAEDETMRRLGTFKDENPVWIMLLSHLKKTYGDRTPHEEGGVVHLSDFRGSGAITFWANDAWAIERNTVSSDVNVKFLTTYHNVKNRDVGYKTGSCVYAMFSTTTGNLRETSSRPAPADKSFDDGSRPKQSSKEKDF